MTQLAYRYILPFSWCLFLVSSPLSAQKQVIPLPTEKIKDKWHHGSVPVSGGEFRGISIKPTDKATVGNQFLVDVPPGDHPEVTVEIITADGKYEGLYRCNLIEQTPGPQVFRWNTEHKKNLSSIPPDEVIIYAYVEKKRGPFLRPYLATATLLDSIPSESTVIFHFNISDVKSHHLEVKLPNSTETIRCFPKAATNHLTNNCECPVPYAIFSEGKLFILYQTQSNFSGSEEKYDIVKIRKL